MPFVSGFLRVRRPHHKPGQPLPGEEEEVDPGYGIDEGELPEVEPPEPPVGIWPPLTPEHPWRPVPGFPERPGHGLPPHLPPARPGQPIPPTPGQPLPPVGEGGGDERPDTGFPPGSIWPPLPPGVGGHYLALVLLKGAKGWRWHYVVVDADAEMPKPPAGGIAGRPPNTGDRPLPEGR